MLEIKEKKIEKKIDRPVCGVDYAFRRIGGKYKARLLWILSHSGVMRYGELRKAILNISPKMLTQALRELEEDELVSRKEYPEIPPKVEYDLTRKGQELIPLIEYLGAWGKKQLEREIHESVVCEH